jgi:hypothetical protein
MNNLKHSPVVLELMDVYRRYGIPLSDVHDFDNHVRSLDSRYFLPELLKNARVLKAQKVHILHSRLEDMKNSLVGAGMGGDSDQLRLAMFPLLRDDENTIDFSDDVMVGSTLSRLCVPLFMFGCGIAFNFELAALTREEVHEYLMQHPLRHIFPRYVPSVIDTTVLENAIRDRVEVGMRLRQGALPKYLLEAFVFP